MASIDLASAIAEALYGTDRTREAAIAAIRHGVEVLYQDNPRFNVAMAMVEVISGAEKTRDYPIVVTKSNIEYIYRPNAFTLTNHSIEYLYEFSSVPLIHSQAGQTLETVTQASTVKSMADTISVERVRQVQQSTVQQSDPMGFPWSLTRVPQYLMEVVQARPVTAQSFDSVAQLRNLTVSRFNYTIPTDVWSKERVAQSVVLVCQSIDIPYQPSSGAYVRQEILQVVQQSEPLPIWRSPAMAGQLAVKVVQALPRQRLPQSNTRVRQVVTQAATPTAMAIPIGLIMAAQSRVLAASPTSMPEPVGVEHAAQVVQLAALERTDAAPQSRTRVAQTVLKAAVPSPLALPVSFVPVKQLTTEVAASANYESPAAMMARTRALQVGLGVVQDADYPSAAIQSTTQVGQGRTQFIQRADANWYQPPGVIYERSKVAIVPQFTEEVAQALPVPLPISHTQVAQMRMYASQGTPMPKPEDMANSGVFISQAIGHVGIKANYPSTDAPQSTVDVSLINESVAVTAQYPDAFLPTNYDIITQVTENVAVIDTFPDVGDLHKPVSASQIFEQLGVISGYPDPGTLHSPVVALQVTEQLACLALYPDKSTVLSFAEVSGVTQQAAFVATYPSKDVPQSKARVNQVRHHVAVRDLTMYQLPTPPRKHRVRIVCRFVY